MTGNAISYSRTELLWQFGFVLSTSILCWVPRAELLLFAILACISALCFWRIAQSGKSINRIFYVCVLGSALWAPPVLSEDIYRFLWDGHLITQGINPHDFTPNELMSSSWQVTKEAKSLYPKITELSRSNYSCYPFVTELYSAISAFFSSGLAAQILMLKLLFLFTGIYALSSLKILFERLGVSNANGWLFLSHPLLLIEGLGNLHFEWIMVALLIISMRLLMEEKWIIGAIVLGFAIQVKLVPLIVIPFLVTSIGWKKATLVGFISGLVVMLTTLTLVYPSNAENFFSALALYYSRFEFNSSIYKLYLSYGKWKYGFYPINHFGIYLSRIAFLLLILLAWFRLDWKDWSTTFKRLTWAFLLYYCCASTVHPWYILVPLLFGTLAGYRFVLWWGFLVWLSYVLYNDDLQPYFSLIKGIEYGLLLVAFSTAFRSGMRKILYEVG